MLFERLLPALAVTTILVVPAAAQEPAADGSFRELEAALRLLGQERFAEAEALALAVVERVPDWGAAWYGLALSRSLQQGRSDDALAAVERSLAIDEAFADAQLLAARLLLPRDRTAASQHARAAARHAGADFLLLRDAVGVCLAAGDLDACRALLGPARELAPRDPGLLVLQAEVALQAGKTVEALDCYREAAALRPSDAAPRESIARILLHLGKKQAALEALVACLQRDPAAIAARETTVALMRELGRPRDEIRRHEQLLRYYVAVREELAAQRATAGPRPQRSR